MDQNSPETLSGTHHGIDQLAATSHGAVDSLANGVSQLAQLLSHKGEQLHDVQRRLSESCRSQIRDKPLAAIGIAVATGFLLSWLVRSRHG